MGRTDPFFELIALDAVRCRQHADNLDILASQLPMAPDDVAYQSVVENSQESDVLLRFTALNKQAALHLVDLLPPAPCVFSPHAPPWFQTMQRAKMGFRICPVVFQVITPPSEVYRFTNFLQWYTFIGDICIYLGVAIEDCPTRLYPDGTAINLPEGENLTVASETGAGIFVFWNYGDLEWKDKLLEVKDEQEEWAQVIE